MSDIPVVRSNIDLELAEPTQLSRIATREELGGKNYDVYYQPADRYSGRSFYQIIWKDSSGTTLIHGGDKTWSKAIIAKNTY